MSQNFKTLKIFIPEHFKFFFMAEYELWESYWMLQNIQNNRKIKSSNKKRVLSTGTPGSILMLFLFHTKKKQTKKENKGWEIMLQYFSMNALHQALFFRLTAYLCPIYICLQPNAESLHSQLLSVRWRGLPRSSFPLFWSLHHHMSSAFLVPPLLSSPSPSQQSQKGIHITLKLPFRSQAETIPWNN